MFGKRSEVNEAKDRYANTEVSYILQRIEQYDGIVILATNYRKNIDEAFMRRIRYVVEFSLPNVQLRKELWTSSFSREIPTKELNYDYLAEQFEMSGGAIKNIVLNASFLAAAENRPVEMTDILRSVRNENVKNGKVMLNTDFGIYAEIMEVADRNI
ncbi:MAG: ATP-binding protein [Lachnospiraceae bacterium]|nr:ATP-binding protein [Lachnospiraceae bacterium]